MEKDNSDLSDFCWEVKDKKEATEENSCGNVNEFRDIDFYLLSPLIFYAGMQLRELETYLRNLF